MEKITILLKTGEFKEVEHRIPPKFVFWRHAQAQASFRMKIDEIAEGQPGASQEALGAAFLESLTDEEGVKYEAFLDDVVRHSHHPQVPVNDMVEESYWLLAGKSLYGFRGAEVQTTEGVTDVETLDTFRQKSGVSGPGAMVSDVREKPGRRNGTARRKSPRRHKRTG